MAPMSFNDAQDQSLNWRKARYSIPCGECVEVASADLRIAVRDSKDPDGARLAYPVTSWRAFVARIKSD
jgi:hypothetical protein